MITREEYLAAVNVVEAYHAQLRTVMDEVAGRQKTPVRKFLNGVRMSARLRSALSRLTRPESEAEIYLEDIDESELRSLRNVGRRSWMEFSGKRERFLRERRL
jgi:hypothetical protein